MRISRAWRERGRTPRDVWSDWVAADEAGDADRAGELAIEMLTVAPDKFIAWFQAGLYSKARTDWRESTRRNERALALFSAEDAQGFGGDNPAAWNLAIAATALGEWATARRAWRADSHQPRPTKPSPSGRAISRRDRSRLVLAS